MTDDIYISKKRLKAHYAWWGETEERKTLDAIVDAQPAADVQEVKHGYWIEHEEMYGDTIYECSVCGEEFVTIDGTPAQNLWRYCPSCGAKMDGKENEK